MKFFAVCVAALIYVLFIRYFLGNSCTTGLATFDWRDKPVRTEGFKIELATSMLALLAACAFLVAR